MQSIVSFVEEKIKAQTSQLFPNKDLPTRTVDYCDTKFGHLSSNFAMQSANTLKQSPLEIATKLADSFSDDKDFSKVEVVKPGFVNFWLSDDLTTKFLTEVYVDSADYIGKQGSGEKMLIDYSHPNIGKPMGVHHLLSTIIGDSIKHLYRQLGYEVIADNFIGDLGTQFGKLIHAVKTWGDISVIEKDPVPELLKLYVKFHIEAEGDDKLDNAGRAEYKKLEEGDVENRELFASIIVWSKAEMQAIYYELGIEFDFMNGESFYEDKMSEIIDLGIDKSIFVRSQGALVVPSDNPDEPPALIQKKDGTSLYLTRDLARVLYWQREFNPQLMVNVVDIAQTMHLKQVYAVAEKLALTNAKNIHVAFGRMNFKDGSMSTRKGNIILVEQVIEETKKRTRQTIVSKSKDLSKTEETELTNVLAINALKYNILRQNRLSNITFDWDTMLSLEGNSAPYICYTVVRINSVQSKLATELEPTSLDENCRFNESEQELFLTLSKASDVFNTAAKHFEPSMVANYTYELSKTYNHFYNTNQIIGSGRDEPKRAILNNTTSRVLQICFKVLGLKIPTKM